ncbi:cbb3-type cytochrome oxidase assembly protein CcoS [candidate division GN15 bacterium]|nr:cbb3-type cytochrome oxidase assembly protein CcoS [candidate division GN15 bacterium]
MEVIIVLIGAALLVAGGFLVAFLWAVRSGQYDDLYTPSVRMLHGDEPVTDNGEATDADNATKNKDSNHNRSSENA